jgi:hypothetical protein
MLANHTATDRLVYKTSPSFWAWEWSFYSIPSRNCVVFMRDFVRTMIAPNTNERTKTIAPTFDPCPMPKWLQVEMSQDLHDARLARINDLLTRYQSPRRFIRACWQSWAMLGLLAAALAAVYTCPPSKLSVFEHEVHLSKQSLSLVVVCTYLLARGVLWWVEWIYWMGCWNTIADHCTGWTASSKQGVVYSCREARAWNVLTGHGCYEWRLEKRVAL